MKILVVDDDLNIQEMLSAGLSRYGYSVQVSGSAIDALSVIEKVKFDLMIIDVMMPDMDGYEICRQLKASEAARLIPVVLVTALYDREAKIKGIDSGADDFIGKPINFFLEMIQFLAELI